MLERKQERRQTEENKRASKTHMVAHIVSISQIPTPSSIPPKCKMNETYYFGPTLSEFLRMDNLSRSGQLKL